MIDRQANAQHPIVHNSGVTLRRHGTAVRRRRAKRAPQAGRWIVARSRKRMLRTAAVCTGVLLLMAVGLYLSLSRQESAPAGDGATKFSPVGFRGVA